MGTARDTRGHTQENYPKHTNIQEFSNMALKYVKYKILYISSTLYQPSDQFNIYAISGDHTCKVCHLSLVVLSFLISISPVELGEGWCRLPRPGGRGKHGGF